MGGLAGPSSFGRQQRLSKITIEPINSTSSLKKIWGAWARFWGEGAVPPWPQHRTATGTKSRSERPCIATSHDVSTQTRWRPGASNLESQPSHCQFVCDALLCRSQCRSSSSGLAYDRLCCLQWSTILATLFCTLCLLLYGARWSAMEHSVAVVDPILERIRLHASVKARSLVNRRRM